MIKIFDQNLSDVSSFLCSYLLFVLIVISGSSSFENIKCFIFSYHILILFQFLIEFRFKYLSVYHVLSCYFVSIFWSKFLPKLKFCYQFFVNSIFASIKFLILYKYFRFIFIICFYCYFWVIIIWKYYFVLYCSITL